MLWEREREETRMLKNMSQYYNKYKDIIFLITTFSWYTGPRHAHWLMSRKPTLILRWEPRLTVSQCCKYHGFICRITWSWLHWGLLKCKIGVVSLGKLARMVESSEFGKLGEPCRDGLKDPQLPFERSRLPKFHPSLPLWIINLPFSLSNTLISLSLNHQPPSLLDRRLLWCGSCLLFFWFLKPMNWVCFGPSSEIQPLFLFSFYIFLPFHNHYQM